MWWSVASARRRYWAYPTWLVRSLSIAGGRKLRPISFEPSGRGKESKLVVMHKGKFQESFTSSCSLMQAPANVARSRYVCVGFLMTGLSSKGPLLLIQTHYWENKKYCLMNIVLPTLVLEQGGSFRWNRAGWRWEKSGSLRDNDRKKEEEILHRKKTRYACSNALAGSWMMSRS